MPVRANPKAAAIPYRRDSATYNRRFDRGSSANDCKRCEINDMELCPKFQFAPVHLVPQGRENIFGFETKTPRQAGAFGVPEKERLKSEAFYLRALDQDPLGLISV
ncbi:hypothetical protein FFI89_021805 [Bradyrhizobium sp. KBS0727]|jgi:hypothetical protein|uniref:hypothetical protein n=1 Tax=unclassified Bradyrhizobium TaxID=2631580 RepID=UPI00110EE571|nr:MULTISPECIES: hypothetical protein [unclassified Bradyrhizobium]QDW39542.1 hypothetical protein FFI71_021810 [Bradyrhizobium sp. KBS0725]QDW46145.1 hypothetical protein FFI89_021805 [Bradyrhizobium sp. KBS0727]